jgi:hemicentin
MASRGDNVTLNCFTSGGPNNSYMWLANNSMMTELTSTLLLPQVNASHGGEYTCLVANIAGGSNSSTILYIEPYVTEHSTVYQEVELMDAAAFYCAADGFPTPEVVWRKVSGNQMDNVVSMTQNLTFTSVTAQDNGTYVCEFSAQIPLGREIAVSVNSTLIGEGKNIASSGRWMFIHFFQLLAVLHCLLSMVSLGTIQVR